MRVAIFHATFDVAGGGERLVLQIARALDELGHEVDLYTTYLDQRVFRLLASDLGWQRPPKVVRAPLAGLLRVVARGRAVRLWRLLAFREVGKYLRRAMEDYDVVVETRSNVPLDVDVSYIHYPAVLDYLADKHTSIHWRVYNWLVMELAERARGSPRLVLTNSSWTAEKVREAYGLEARVLYPPVEVERFEGVDLNRKENIVLTVSRFSQEKNLDTIVRIARLVPEAQFYVVGSTSPYSRPVINRLTGLIDELGAKKRPHRDRRAQGETRRAVLAGKDIPSPALPRALRHSHS